MKPIVGAFDNFFLSPDLIFDEITLGLFEDYKSSFDGVVYPNINTFIPNYISSYIQARLEEIIDGHVDVTAMFARLTPKGTVAPHKIHSDKIMGEFSAHIYMSRQWPVGAGTSFWTHQTEGTRHTESTDVGQIVIDQNDATAWDTNQFVQGKYNRLLIHDSTLWHAAEPAGGFGTNVRDGRLVLTTFFNGVGN